MARKKTARKSAGKKNAGKSARPAARKATKKGAKRAAKKSARKTVSAKRSVKKKAAGRGVKKTATKKKTTAKRAVAKKTVRRAAAKSTAKRAAARSTAKRTTAKPATTKRVAAKKSTGPARQPGRAVGGAIAKMAGKVSAAGQGLKPTRRPVATKPAWSVETAAARTVAPRPSTAAAPAPVTPVVGDPAPGFQMRDAQGSLHTLNQYAGKRVVLYFYPKDDTPGCTTEACGFRNVHGEFDTADAVLLGVSPDSSESHAGFAAKYGLPFTLLSDEGHQVAERYGVWREKQNYGKTYMGIARTTFIIDEAGRIAKVFPNVSPQGHEGQVLAWLREHQLAGAGANAGGASGSGEGGSLFGGI